MLVCTRVHEGILKRIHAGMRAVTRKKLTLWLLRVQGEAEEGDKSFLESERRELTKARDTLKTIVEALGG